MASLLLAQMVASVVYLVTLTVLAFVAARARAPGDLGTPYHREG